jgi:proline dehydrogenase
MNELGARVRLVKGAYKEAPGAALQRKSDVDAAFLALAKLLLDRGTYPAIATHDEPLLQEVCRYAEARRIDRRAFEFQLLYGIRRDLQRSLAGSGYPVRIYVPFGREWFPYFMRRLGERPANVGFVVRAILRDR